MPDFYINSLTEARCLETECGVYFLSCLECIDNFWYADR